MELFFVPMVGLLQRGFAASQNQPQEILKILCQAALWILPRAAR